MAGRVYLSSLPCYKEREVGEEKGLGGRFSLLLPPLSQEPGEVFTTFSTLLLNWGKINPLRKKVHSLNSTYAFRKF